MSADCDYVVVCFSYVELSHVFVVSLTLPLVPLRFPFSRTTVLDFVRTEDRIVL